MHLVLAKLWIEVKEMKSEISMDNNVASVQLITKEDEEEEDDEQVEIVNREKLKKKKVRSSPSVEEGQKWKREELAEEEEEKPDMTVKTVAPLSYRRSRRKNTPVKSW